MDVSGNKVIDVRDYAITVFAGSYDDATRTQRSTYGRLSFKVSTLELYSATCWLKGTVTGSDNDIEVTWSM